MNFLFRTKSPGYKSKRHAMCFAFDRFKSKLYQSVNGCCFNVMPTFVIVLCLFTVALTSQCVAQLPTDLPWSGSNVDGQNVIVQPGIAIASCGTLVSIDEPERYCVGLFNIAGQVPNSGRVDATLGTQVYHHPSWLIEEIGNVFGVAVNERTGEMFFCASSNYGAGFWQQDSVLRYGNIGGGENDLLAAGTDYRADEVTGQASVFTRLPQQLTTFTHENCEGTDAFTRTTGVGLGNIHYDSIHDQYFVTNIEDGRIYRISTTGNILDSYDPGIYDDGLPGISDLEDLVVGIAVEPDGSRLFLGGLSSSNSVPLWSIDLSANGGFVGTIANSNLPTGATWDNYVGDETLHTTIATSNSSQNPFHHIADLEFTSEGKLLAGVRIGCRNNWATSYNHSGESNEISPVAGIYSSVKELDLAYLAPVRNDSYGGVADFEHDAGIDYVVSSADILQESGPHGLAVFQSAAVGGPPIAPLAAISYGLADNGDPKGVGGSVDVFNNLKNCTFESNNLLCDLDEMSQLTGDFVITGAFTNLQDIPGTHLFMPTGAVSPAGVEVCFGNGQQTMQLNPPLNNGDSYEVGSDLSNANAIIIKNAMPGDEVCFLMTLIGDNGVECCTLEVCFEMPPCDCLQVDRRLDEISEIVCNDDGTVDFSYSFQLTNLFGIDVYHCFLGSLGNELFDPDYFDLTSTPLATGQSVQLKTIVRGAQPEALTDFLITIHNEDLSECCTRVHDVLAPVCDGTGANKGGFLLGDLSGDGLVNLSDVQPFVQRLSSGQYMVQGDINQDGTFDLADVTPFVELLTGNL